MGLGIDNLVCQTGVQAWVLTTECAGLTFGLEY